MVFAFYIMKYIPGYEWLYSVTKEWEIYAHPRKSKWWHNGKFMKLTLNRSTWYLQVALTKNKKTIWYRVHRLVWLTYIPNHFWLPQINHVNGIKIDNRIENLEWVNNSQNNIHSYRVLWRKTNSEKLKKKVKQLNIDGWLVKIYKWIIDAHKSTGVSRWSISSCCTKRPRYYTAWWFRWEYLE